MTRLSSLSWRIGGPQGHGIDSAQLLFSRTCAKTGFYVLSQREYHSNIMGRHSYSDVQVSNIPVSGQPAITDLLVCLDAETFCRHFDTVASKGILVIDEADLETDSRSLKYLDREIRETLVSKLDNKATFKVAELIPLLDKKQVQLVRVSFSAARDSLQKNLSLSRSMALRSKNIFLVAISAAILNIAKQSLLAEIEIIFQGKEQAIDLNHAAIELAYQFVEANSPGCQLCLPEAVSAQEAFLMLNGCQATALGKLVAGIGMQPYYPISPATDESVFMQKNDTVFLQDGKAAGPVIVQTEDELAAITMAAGAALTGTRVATSTSGPGFSLMAEGLGWAGMNEVALVITLYQRGGPSTGMPTRTEQGDLQFAIHAGHGEFPRIVIASGDVSDCFYDAFRAFNYAERYQLPVIHLLDKHLASTTQTVLPFDTDKLEIDRGRLASPAKDDIHLPRFDIDESGISHRPLLGEKGQVFWSSGVEHTEFGQVSENPQQRKKMMEKRARKLEQALAEIPFEDKLEVYGDKDASLVILSWGSNKGVIVDAVGTLQKENKPVRAIMVKILWPFPEQEIKALLDGNCRIVTMECNQTGQFSHLLQEQAALEPDHQLLKYTGRPFLLEEVMQHIDAILKDKADKIISIA